MATTLKFTGTIGSTDIDVEYRANLINQTDDNFTASWINGITDEQIAAGINFRRLAYTLTEFKAFATTNNLNLDRIDSTGTTRLITAS